jgi:hypothetical protein
MEDSMSREVNRRRGVRSRLLTQTLLCVLLVLAAALPAAAQFSSGSTGVHGSFPPLPEGLSAIPSGAQYLVWNMSTGLIRYCSAYDTVNRPETCTTEVGTGQIPGIPEGGLLTGTFHFTNVRLLPGNAGVLYVYFVGNANNAPLSILAQTTIETGYNVHIYADGMPGQGYSLGLVPNTSLAGGRPGPGGFAGGSSGFPGVQSVGGTGFGAAGGTGGTYLDGNCYGAPNNGFGFNAGPARDGLIAPLVGGSGGGGGAGDLACGVGHSNGASGGGGGGAILMAASTQITFGYTLFYLMGANGGQSWCFCFEGGGGAGGTLRLVAPKLVSTSTVGASLYGGNSPRGGAAGGGTYRIEGDASTFDFRPTGQAHGTLAALPAALIPPATPTLRITAVGDLTVPAAPSANVNNPDVTFQTPPTGPVAVTLAGSNIPVGTTAVVRVTPQVGQSSEVTSTGLAGTSADSTATASVTIPPGFGVITASASFTCPDSLCSTLLAQERIGARVEVVASIEGSRAFIVTGSGRRIPIGSAN